MKVYRVQLVGAQHVACPTVYKDEKAAQAETAMILKGFVLQNLNAMVRHNARWNTRPEFVQAGTAFLVQAQEMLAQGRTWEAYDAWQDFYDAHEMDFGPPLWMVLGSVNVDTREAEPLRKRRLFEATPAPPYESVQEPTEIMEAAELEVISIIKKVQRLVQEKTLRETGREITSAEFKRQARDVVKEIEQAAQGAELPWESQATMVEDALKKRFGLSGTMRVWKVTYLDILCLIQGGGGCVNSYTDEELAKEHTASLLRTVVGRLDDQARTASDLGRAPQFVLEARQSIPLVRAALEESDVWRAYTIWREFEERHPFGPEPQLGYPLHTQIGSLRVEVR